MTPLEFVLWLNGAAGVVGEQPPTAEQWAKMHEKLDEVVGGIVASRLLEEAEGLAKKREEQRIAAEQMFGIRKVQLEQQARMAQAYAQQLDELTYKTLAATTSTAVPTNGGILSALLGAKGAKS